MVQQLGQIVHDDVGAVLPEGIGLPGPVDSHHITKPPSPAGFHAGQRILEHHGLLRLQPQGPSPGQEGIGGRLPPQVFLLGDHAVDPRLEQVLDADGVAAAGPDR